MPRMDAQILPQGLHPSPQLHAAPSPSAVTATVEQSYQQKSESSTPQSSQKEVTQSGGEGLTEDVRSGAVVSTPDSPPTAHRRKLPNAPRGVGVDHPVGDASRKQVHPKTTPLITGSVKGNGGASSGVY